MNETKGKEQEERFSPFTELCKFCDDYHLIVELDKPFNQMDNMILKIIDPDENELARVTLEDIEYIENESATLLNKLSKESSNWQ